MSDSCSFCVPLSVPLSPPPWALPPSPSPSAQTSVSFRPLSSAAPTGTPAAWPRRSPANCPHKHIFFLSASYHDIPADILEVLTSVQLTWQVCTQGRCLWSPFPPVCSVCTARSVECASALSGPPYSRRLASLGASWNRSGSRSQLAYTYHNN